MKVTDDHSRQLIYRLNERQKELNCIYKVENILTDFDSPLEKLFLKILKVIPEGWQYPENCFTEIEYKGKVISIHKNDKGEYQQKSPLIQK